MHLWIAFLVGLVVGLAAGFRWGTYYLPSLIGRMSAWALRGDIRRYRKRGRRLWRAFSVDAGAFCLIRAPYRGDL